MNDIQIQQMLYLLREINNNLIVIKHLTDFNVPANTSWVDVNIQKEQDEVLKELIRINDDMIKDSMY